MPTIKKGSEDKKSSIAKSDFNSAQPGQNKSGVFVFLLVILLIISIGGFVWSFGKYQKTKDRVALLSTQEGQLELAKKESSELLEMVKKHILLPTDEDPVIATIIDASALKAQQEFYRDANNDDRLIIYKQKAIIYSVARDIIVNVGPVFIQEGDELVNPEVNETSEGGLEVSELNPPLSNDISDSGTPTDTNPIVE